MLGRPRQCATCLCRAVYASRTGRYRRLWSFLFIRPFRCEHCRRVMWRFSPLPGRRRPEPND